MTGAEQVAHEAREHDDERGAHDEELGRQVSQDEQRHADDQDGEARGRGRRGHRAQPRPPLPDEIRGDHRDQESVRIVRPVRPLTDERGQHGPIEPGAEPPEQRDGGERAPLTIYPIAAATGTDDGVDATDGRALGCRKIAVATASATTAEPSGVKCTKS